MESRSSFPRKVEIHSNQYYAEGICHALGAQPDGTPYALIERSDGSVDVLALNSCYHIKLGQQMG
jgi:hypothetical protein